MEVRLPGNCFITFAIQGPRVFNKQSVEREPNMYVCIAIFCCRRVTVPMKI